MKVVSVVGAPWDAMHLAPVDRALAQRPGVGHTVVHTRRHGDPEPRAAIVEEWAVAAPVHLVMVDAGSPAAYTAAVMARLEPVLDEARPDLVLVYGAGEAALAAALVAAQLGLRVGHVEAGLRGDDPTHPDHRNQAIADRLADLLFAPSRDAVDNLRGEGIAEHRVHFVGAVTIDSLEWALPRARQVEAAARYGVAGAPYAVAALRTPANVDQPATLHELVEALERLTDVAPVVCALPRGSFAGPRRGELRFVEAPDHLVLLGLVADAALVVTDWAALEEATSYLGVPCLTIGSGADRPVTCLHGTNRLVAAQRDVVLAAAQRALRRRSPARPLIERWDGRAAERIAAVVCDGAHFPADGEPVVATPPRAPRRGIAIPQLANTEFEVSAGLVNALEAVRRSR